MKRFSNILDKSNKKSVISIGIVLVSLLIISAVLMICIPNINFALVEEKNTVAKNISNKVEENTISLEEMAEKREEYLNSINSENILLEKDSETNNNENKVKENINNKIVKEDVNSHENVVNDATLIQTNKENNETSITDKNESILVENSNNSENANIVLEKPLKDGKYTISYEFGNSHTGIDLVAIKGTEILASAPGVVVFSEHKSSYGKLILIDHGNNLLTYYAHCSEICVNEGQKVNAGDIIAKVGATGNTTGPQLHFEVREAGNPKNPQNYINF